MEGKLKDVKVKRNGDYYEVKALLNADGVARFFEAIEKPEQSEESKKKMSIGFKEGNDD